MKLGQASGTIEIHDSSRPPAGMIDIPCQLIFNSQMTNLSF
jgi:hypothetical protein